MRLKFALALVLTFLAFAFAASVAVADEPTAPATPAAQGDEGVPAVATQPDATAPDTGAAGIEAGTPEPIEQCGSCVGTLGYFVDPSCFTCNVNSRACDLACLSHGGTARFSCGGGSVYCECEDGVYDSCACAD